MTNFPVLKLGDTGNVVVFLQMMLYDIYKDAVNIEIDGIFGEETETAILTFQKTNDLIVDGVVGNDETWPKLINAWWRRA